MNNIIFKTNTLDKYKKETNNKKIIESILLDFILLLIFVVINIFLFNDISKYFYCIILLSLFILLILYILIIKMISYISHYKKGIIKIVTINENGMTITSNKGKVIRSVSKEKLIGYKDNIDNIEILYLYTRKKGFIKALDPYSAEVKAIIRLYKCSLEEGTIENLIDLITK